MPLAIELAAPWVRAMSCQEIARELEGGITILTGTSPHLPSRHRSLPAVFDRSWNLLSPEAQGGFRRLAVFEGGFSRPAAEQVAGASLAVIGQLIDASVLHQAAPGCYAFHPLLRQYGAAKLAGDPRDKACVQANHAAYFISFLRVRQGMLLGREQARGLAEITGEMDNLRAAWAHAVESGVPRTIEMLAEGLFLVHEFRAWFQEGIALFHNAITRLEARPEVPGSARVRGKLLARQGRLHARLGQLDQARELLEGARAIATREGAPGDEAFALTYLGEVQWRSGQYDEAVGALEASVARYHALLARASADTAPALRWGLANALNNLGIVLYHLGRYDEAERRYEESLALRRVVGDRLGTGAALVNLGINAYNRREFQQARDYFREGLAIARELDAPGRVATALVNLGEVALELAEYAEAEEHFQQSLAIFREVGQVRGQTIALICLGRLCLARHAWEPAERFYHEALHLAFDAQATPLVLEALLGFAILLRETGKPQLALDLLALISIHPGTEPTIQAEALRLANEALAGEGEAPFAALQEEARQWELFATARTVLLARAAS